MKKDQRMAEQAIDVDPGDPLYKSWRFDVSLWLQYYWWPTRRWSARLSLWWFYTVRRYPKPPPLHLDPVYKRLFEEDGR